jgi:hypothetical protein
MSRRFRGSPAPLQTLTGETLFLAAQPATVHQNEIERRTLYEILDSKDLCDSPVRFADVGILGIRYHEIPVGGHRKTPA